MDLATISLDQQKAIEYAAEYREAFRKEHQEIDGELMRGFAQIAKGRQLIRLSETIMKAGFDDLGRPKIAVSRADEQRVTYSRHGTTLVFQPPWRSGSTITSPDRRLVIDNLLEAPSSTWLNTWEAILPIIPPRFRPPYQLHNYHLLWEAAWVKPQRAKAPVDPALLRRIGGDLFAVLAVWDLTPLERAVLEMRPS